MLKRIIKHQRTPPTKNIQMRIMLFCTFVLVVIVAVGCIRTQRKLSMANQRLRVLETAIEEEGKRTEEIDELKAYMQSDEYKIKIAKEKIGLIEDGEIIFKGKKN